MKKYITNNFYKIILIILLLLSIVAVYKTSINGVNIIFNLSIGYIVSFIFFFIVVYLPEIKKRKDLKENLSQALSFIIEAHSGNPFHWSKHIIHCKPLKSYQRKIVECSCKVKTRNFNELQIKSIIESSHEILPTFEQLIPVAYQLSHKEAMLWISLTNSIRQLATLYPYCADNIKNRDMGVFDLNLQEFLEYLKQFNKIK